MSSVKSGSVPVTETLLSLPSWASDDDDRSKDKDTDAKDKDRQRFAFPWTSDEEVDKKGEKNKDRERLFSFPWILDDDKDKETTSTISRGRRRSRLSDEERESLFYDIRKGRRLSRGSSKVSLKEPTFVSITLVLIFSLLPLRPDTIVLVDWTKSTKLLTDLPASFPSLYDRTG